MEAMKLCMMSLQMADASPREIVDCAVECGMGAVDWVTLHRTTARELRRITEDAGLAVAAHTPLNHGFISGKSDGMEEFRRSLEDARELGAPVIMIPPFPLQGQTSMAEARKRWIGFYQQALPAAREVGVTLGVESTGFPESPVVSGAELAEVLRAVPGAKIVFDNGNVATADDMTAAFEMVKDHVVHFHLKDWVIADAPFEGSGRKRTGRYYRNSVIGEGTLDLKTFLLDHVLPVYHGWFNLETSDPSGKRSPREVMLQSCRTLRAYFA